MLQADAAAGIEERLEVLVVVVAVVLAVEDRLDQVAVAGGRVCLERRDVVEVSQPVGDGTFGRRRAFQRRNDADHVDQPAVRGGVRLDADNFHLLVRQAERRVRQPASGPAQQPHIFVGHRHAIDGVERHHQEADRMDRRHGARRQHRALHAFLTAIGHEGADVLEAAELRLVDGRLGANRQRLADLGNDDADLPGGNLHERMPRHRVPGPELKAEARRQQVGLVAGCAVEGDWAAAVDPFPTDALADEADLGGADHPERLHPNHDHDEQCDDKCIEPRRGGDGLQHEGDHGVASFRATPEIRSIAGGGMPAAPPSCGLRHDNHGSGQKIVAVPVAAPKQPTCEAWCQFPPQVSQPRHTASMLNGPMLRGGSFCRSRCVRAISLSFISIARRSRESCRLCSKTSNSPAAIFAAVMRPFCARNTASAAWRATLASLSRTRRSAPPIWSVVLRPGVGSTAPATLTCKP